MITLNGQPAVVAEKLSLGRVRIKTEDGKSSQVYTANQLSEAIMRRDGRLFTADHIPPTARDKRVFGAQKKQNQLAIQLGIQL